MSATTAEEMAGRYDPAAVESAMRSKWEGSGALVAGRPEVADRPTFTIMIPPPNVTGVLHMGHALNGTLQDIVARHRRLTGFDVLWLPGTDHAGIATQAVVERKLFQEEDVTREQLGRQAFLGKVWEWKEKHGNQILEQFKRLGASCDWSRTAFTLDPGLSEAVRESFVRLWEQGLIYRGARLVNWDCVLQTAISDDEIEFATRKGHLWHLKYPVKQRPGTFVTVATTRPETMLGDTGVAVHPADERYRDLVGETLVLPLVDREIPIVADDTVDPEFGSGAVKVTPGHDPNDYERGRRHDLPVVNILEQDGSLNENAGPFAGLPRGKARQAVCDALEELGLLAGLEEIEHNVPLSDRSKTVIEPLISEQWFVKMEPLARPAIAAVQDGSLKFQPERWTKVYLDWLQNVRDWCISRQLWWGHRIPVWYDADGVGVASRTDLEIGAPHPKTGKPIVRQDDDVLDTWASSWLWPLATLGWPQSTPDLARYYPTQFLSTASEIIYLWVARMVMAGYAFADDRPEGERCPFSTCYIHATVLDAQGRRMSKSAGNGIDPLDMIDQYGADAVRFSLVMLTKEGQDTKLAPEKFEMGRNFLNKLWNASRFVLIKAGTLPPLDPGALEVLEDRWLVSRLAHTVEAMHSAYEQYRFNDAANLAYRFVWNDLCDWYVEASKPRLEAGDRVAAAVLGRVLGDVLVLLHPLAPFATEAVWERVRDAREDELPPMLMTASWPDASTLPVDDEAEGDLGAAQAVVATVRRLRQQNGVAERKPATVTVIVPDAAAAARLQRAGDLIGRMGAIETCHVTVDGPRPEGAAAAVVEGLEVLLHLAGLVDVEAQRKDLTRGLEKLDKQLAGLAAKLGNAAFTSKAPADVVAREQQRSAELTAERARLAELLAALG